MENVNLNDMVNAATEAGQAQAQQTASGMMSVLSGDTTFMGNKANIVGGLLGAAAAATLELVSPTGTKGSAIAAFATGAAVTGLCRNGLMAVPNNGGTATVTGLVTFVASKYIGRSVSDYFPGYCHADKEVQATEIGA